MPTEPFRTIPGDQCHHRPLLAFLFSLHEAFSLPCGETDVADVAFDEAGWLLNFLQRPKLQARSSWHHSVAKLRGSQAISVLKENAWVAQWMKTTVSGPSWPGNYEYGSDTEWHAWSTVITCIPIDPKQWCLWGIAARTYLACPEPTQVMANGIGGWSYIPIDLLLYVLYKSGRDCPTPFLIICLDFNQTCPMRVRLAVDPSEISGASRSTPRVRPSKAYLQSNTCFGVTSLSFGASSHWIFHWKPAIFHKHQVFSEKSSDWKLRS